MKKGCLLIQKIQLPTISSLSLWYYISGERKMYKVKVFDESHERDLESKVNAFLQTLENKEIIDIKYEVAITMFSEEQIYCFSAMILYKD